jgi:hypothetical protein
VLKVNCTGRFNDRESEAYAPLLGVSRNQLRFPLVLSAL